MPNTYNALRHGAFIQLTVLPWENQADFDALHEALREEYSPQGPSEEAIILDIADLHWRKQRLRYGFSYAVGRATDDAREAKPGAGRRMTFSEALDFVRSRGAAERREEKPEAPAQEGLERAYDPDFMMKYARVEAAVDGRMTKLYQRLAGIKALKKMHQLESEQAMPQLPAPSVQPEPERPNGWSAEVLNRANRR